MLAAQHYQNFDSLPSPSNANRCQPKEPMTHQYKQTFGRNRSSQNSFQHLQETFGPSAVSQQGSVQQNTQQPQYPYPRSNVPQQQNQNAQQYQFQVKQQQYQESNSKQHTQTRAQSSNAAPLSKKQDSQDYQNIQNQAPPMKQSAFQIPSYQIQAKTNNQQQQQQQLIQQNQQGQGQQVTQLLQNQPTQVPTQSLKQSHQFQQQKNFQAKPNQQVDPQKIQQQTPYPQQERQALQNKTNIPNNTLLQSPATIQQQAKSSNIYYVSNGTSQQPTQKNSIQPSMQLQPRQATPLKAQEGGLKQLAKQIQSPGNPGQSHLQQAMYSPMPKSQTDQQGKVYQLQSNVVQTRSPQLQHVGQGLQQRQQTNSQILVEQLNREKDKHRMLATKLTKLEQEQKSQNTLFLNDLEKRIKYLIQQNDQLLQKNQELNHMMSQNKFDQEREDLKTQISQARDQNSQLEGQSKDLTQQIIIEQQRCNDLEIRIEDADNNENEEQQIRVLVGDLEDKVQDLIVENERLNYVLNEQGQDRQKHEQLNHLQNEKQKLQKMIEQNTKDIEQWKVKYEDLLKKYTSLENGKGDLRVYKSQVDDLENKIRALIQENDELNEVVQQQIQNETQIGELEDHMQNLVAENDRLENELVQLKQKQRS